MVSSSVDTQYVHYYWALLYECFTINLWETKLLWNLNQSTRFQKKQTKSLPTKHDKRAHPFTYSLTHQFSLIHLAHSPTQSFTYSLTNLITHSLIPILLHFFTHVTLIDSLSHSLIHLFTHSIFTHSLLTHCSLTHYSLIAQLLTHC